MPCMGPHMPDDKEIDSVTEEVLQFLKEKHRVLETEKSFYAGLTLVENSRTEMKKSLRAVIKKLLVDRNCEEF